MNQIKYVIVCNLHHHEKLNILMEYNIIEMDVNILHETIHYILSKINRDCKSSYIAHNLTFNYIFKDELFFLTISDNKRISFALLNKLISEFLNKKSTNLKELVNYYNKPDSDQIYSLNQKVLDTSIIMKETISGLVERSEKIEGVMDAANDVEISSENLGEAASEKRIETSKNNMCVSIIFIVVLVIICFISIMAILFFIFIVFFLVKVEFIS